MTELALSCLCVFRASVKACVCNNRNCMWNHNKKTAWAEQCSHGVSLHNLGSQMPIKGARMQPCSVAKCQLFIFHATIYYCRHSKHINDRPRCAQDNGITCLKLQSRFLFWRPQTLNDVHAHTTHTRAHKHTHSLSNPSKPTFEMQAALVSHRAHLPVTHSHHLNWRAGPLSISPRPFSCSLCASPFTVPCPWSKTALWHRVRHPGDRKHQTGQRSNSQKEKR